MTINKPLTQMEFIHDFNNETRPQFNPILFERSDDALIESIEDVILSCQRDSYFTIRVEQFTVVKDYAKVNKILSDYEQQRIDKLNNKNGYKNKNLFNKYETIDINDSMLMLLIVDYYIAVNDGVTNPHDNLRVLIALPKIVEKYYYRLNGNYSYAMYQIVDGSTYNNTSSRSKYQNVVYKTIFMPTRIYRNVLERVDYNGCPVKCILYTAKLFSKFNPVMEYIFAKFGLLQSLYFMGLQNVIHINDHLLNIKDSYCFEQYGVYIEVPKIIFDNDIVTQTTVMTIYGRIGNLIDEVDQPELALMYDKEKKKEKHHNIIDALINGEYGSKILSDIMSDWYWLKSLALRFNSRPTVDKGLSVLDSLESIYDLESYKTLRLPEEDKATIYHILRWLVREFPSLRLKDNVDISTKKVRREGHLSAGYGTKLCKGIYRASDSQKKITVEDIKRYINIDPMYLIGLVLKNKLVSFRDDVNDNDAFIPLKFSYKGLSGLGEQKNSTVPDAYKYVHPSHLGRVDVDTSSAGDPGMTGIICPMAQIEQNSFADGDYMEPNDWDKNFDDLIKQYVQSTRKIQLVEFQQNMGIISKSESSILLDQLEEDIKCTKNILQLVSWVDDSTEILPVDLTENGEMIVYDF